MNNLHYVIVSEQRKFELTLAEIQHVQLPLERTTCFAQSNGVNPVLKLDILMTFCSLLSRNLARLLNEITVGDGLDGGDLLSMLAGGGKVVSSTGLLGSSLEVDLNTSLGGLGLGGLVGNLAS